MWPLPSNEGYIKNCPNFAQSRRVSGTANDAICEMTCTLPKAGIPGGRYSAFLLAHTSDGHYGGHEVSFDVDGDTAPPRVSNFEVSRSAPRLGDVVTVSFRVRDSAGIGQVTTRWAHNETAEPVRACATARPRRTSGTDTDAAYSVSCSFPNSGLTAGWYEVTVVAKDDAGFEEVGSTSFEVAAFRDGVGLSIIDVQVSPLTVATGETVVVSFKVTDNGGIKGVAVGWEDPRGRGRRSKNCGNRRKRGTHRKSDHLPGHWRRLNCTVDS